MAYQGKFQPKNPQKYRGDASNIVYRSSWELKLMATLDSHPDVIEWASEEIVIPYRSPIDGKLHRYFPDFYVKKRTVEGKIEHVLIEVKPEAQVREPKIQETKNKKPSRKYIKEVTTYVTNQAKWESAAEYRKDRNWKFQEMTEHHLGIKY
jgi:hypothetical protein